MSKFWEPLREEYKWNPHGILNLIGSIGIIPAIFVGRYVDSYPSMVCHRLPDLPYYSLFQKQIAFND